MFRQLSLFFRLDDGPENDSSLGEQVPLIPDQSKFSLNKQEKSEKLEHTSTQKLDLLDQIESQSEQKHSHAKSDDVENKTIDLLPKLDNIDIPILLNISQSLETNDLLNLRQCNKSLNQKISTSVRFRFVLSVLDAEYIIVGTFFDVMKRHTPLLQSNERFVELEKKRIECEQLLQILNRNYEHEFNKLIDMEITDVIPVQCQRASVYANGCAGFVSAGFGCFTYFGASSTVVGSWACPVLSHPLFCVFSGPIGVLLSSCCSISSFGLTTCIYSRYKLHSLFSEKNPLIEARRKEKQELESQILEVKREVAILQKFGSYPRI